MSWIRAFVDLNKSLLLKGLLLLMVFLLGLQMGQSRLQRQWDAEKQTVRTAQAKQEQHAADVAHVQNQISKEISDDYFKKSIFLADGQFGAHAVRVCNIATASSRDVPILSQGSTGADATSTNLVPVAAADQVMTSCAQLVKDSGKTTLMLLEFQNWYEKQASSITTKQ